MRLEPPFDALANPWILLLLGLLLTVEVFADKIPVVDTINDLIGTAVRPTAGAILALAGTREVALDPVLAAGLGLVVAGGVHGLKATSRPAVTAVSGGLANPIVSMIEDILAAGMTILTLLAPVAGLVLVVAVIGGLAYLAWRVRRWFRRSGRRRGAAPPRAP